MKYCPYCNMYAAAMGNTITAVFQCLSAISVKGFLALSLRWFLLVAFLYLSQMFEYALLFGRSVLFFSGGCRFPADLIFPLCKVTVVLFHNAFHFSESPHKNLHIGITVLFERIGDFVQFVSNLCFGS